MKSRSQPASLVRMLSGSLALLFALAAPAFAQTTLNPTADSYVRSGTSNQNTNFGTSTDLYAKDGPASPGDEDYETFLKFDLTSVASIGSGSKLRLFKGNVTPTGITNQVRSSTNTSWIESGTGSITWANKPGLTSTIHATGTWPSQNNWAEWDITAFLQAEKAAGRNIVTLVVRSTLAQTQTTNAPRADSRTNASNPPQLAIVTGETTPPTVAITAPTGGTVTGSIAVSATASDNVGVVGVQFKLDGVNLGEEDTASPYSVTWNTAEVDQPGSHALTAVARDAAGNSTTSAAVNVTVADQDAPAVAITAPTGGTASNSIAVSATASDNVGVVGVQFKLDGVNLGAEDTSSPFSITWDTTTATNGSHTLTAVVRDAAGNATTSASIAVTVSNVAGTLSYSAKKTLASITVDGVLNESVWGEVGTTETVAKLVGGGTQNNTVTFGAMWDTTYLYIGVRVLDTQLFNDTTNTGTPPTNVWQDDSVEVYLDGNHNHATSYELTGGANGLGNDRQFTKGYNDTALGSKGSQTGVLHGWAAITGGGGYTVEIAIPWSNINVTGAAGLTIGFDVANNDDDNGSTTRETQVVWNGLVSNFNNTAAFGHLTLSATTVGTGGTPEINVQGGSPLVSIVDGDATPTLAKGTDFGNADVVSGSVEKTFNIQNTGTATLSSISVTTTNGEFGLLTAPPTSIAAGGNANFTIAFIPTATGNPTATLNIASNDADESPYNFSLKGTGTASAFVVGLNPQAHTGGMNATGKAHMLDLRPHSLRLGGTVTNWEANLDWANENGMEVLFGFGYAEGEDVLTAAGRQIYADRAAQTALTVGNRAKYFNVWNEWNGGFGLGGSPSSPGASDAAMYTDLLRRTYIAVKAVKPDAIICGGVIAGANETFLTGMLNAGAADYLDILDIHLYVYRQGWPGHVAPNAPGSVGAAKFMEVATARRDLVQQMTGKNMKIMMSEAGFHLNDDPPLTTAGQEQIGADYLTAVYNAARASGFIEGIWWFQLRSHVRVGGSISPHGLVRNNDTLRPKYFSFKTQAAQ